MIKKIIKSIIFKFRYLINILKRNFKKLVREVVSQKESTIKYTFSTICVNRVEYVDLAIDNINSLHYLNNSHKFKIYCDAVCFEYLQNNKKKLDYIQNVEFIKEWDKLDFPWQFAKIKLLEKYLGKEDIIFLDADIKWLNEPTISMDKVTFFIKEYNLSSSTRDMVFFNHLLPELNTKEIDHCNVTLLSIPKKFHSKDLVFNWMELAKKINSCSNVPNMSEADNKQMNRLCEQMSASIVFQQMFKENVDVLQNDDKPYIHSYYYGAINGIQ